jgi:hypothetical protein
VVSFAPDIWRSKNPENRPSIILRFPTSCVSQRYGATSTLHSPPLAIPTRTKCSSIERVLEVLREDYGEIALLRRCLACVEPLSGRARRSRCCVLCQNTILCTLLSLKAIVEAFKLYVEDQSAHYRWRILALRHVMPLPTHVSAEAFLQEPKRFDIVCLMEAITYVDNSLVFRRAGS